MLTTDELEHLMRYDGHIGGDKCGPERVVKDAAVVARKDHGGCFVCFGSMPRGTHNRVTVVVWDGEFLSSRICEDCCRAMALCSASGDSTAIDDRYELGCARSKN